MDSFVVSAGDRIAGGEMVGCSPRWSTGMTRDALSCRYDVLAPTRWVSAAGGCSALRAPVRR